MSDNQVFTNQSNSHCSPSQPVQNLTKFSFRIKRLSALSADRRLLLSVKMVGCPIKCQRQPLAGRVIQVTIIDTFLFACFCEASSVNTACGNSISCIKGIKRGYWWRVVDARQWVSGKSERRLLLATEYRLPRLLGYQLLIVQWHQT